MRARQAIAALFVCGVLGLGAVRASAERDETVRDGRYTMGTVLEVTLVARPGAPPHAARAAADRIFGEVARLDGLLSRHDPASALSELNRHAGGAPVEVPEELAQILADAVAYSARTRGAFDVTVGPLVALWTAAGRANRLPDAAQLARARARVGAGRIAFGGGRRVALPLPGMQVDLGGLAKGWALDRVADVAIPEADLAAALLDFGRSSIVARGAPPGAPGWRLLLRGPGAEPVGTLTLRDCALSVSSSLGQSTTIGGRRYGHVLDPRTGWPLERQGEAVVVASRGALAEALTKALLVLPPDDGLALVAALPGADALLIGPDGASRETPGWRAASGFEPLEAAAAAFRSAL